MSRKKFCLDRSRDVFSRSSLQRSIEHGPVEPLRQYERSLHETVRPSGYPANCMHDFAERVCSLSVPARQGNSESHSCLSPTIWRNWQLDWHRAGSSRWPHSVSTELWNGEL